MLLIVSHQVKAILLTSAVKLLNLYPEQTAAAAWELLQKYSTSSDLELQQRACEYSVLAAEHLQAQRQRGGASVPAQVLETVLNTMPVSLEILILRLRTILICRGVLLWQTFELQNSENILLNISSGLAAEQTVTDRSGSFDLLCSCCCSATLTSTLPLCSVDHRPRREGRLQGRLQADQGHRARVQHSGLAASQESFCGVGVRCVLSGLQASLAAASGGEQDSGSAVSGRLAPSAPSPLDARRPRPSLQPGHTDCQ